MNSTRRRNHHHLLIWIWWLCCSSQDSSSLFSLSPIYWWRIHQKEALLFGRLSRFTVNSFLGLNHLWSFVDVCRSFLESSHQQRLPFLQQQRKTEKLRRTDGRTGRKWEWRGGGSYSQEIGFPSSKNKTQNSLSKGHTHNANGSSHHDRRINSRARIGRRWRTLLLRCQQHKRRTSVRRRDRV